uniref:Uncharacterized protein n=1 Tax=viral metagenome TaxID=1070528 RepID=A0A6M3JQ84_9ZZZZ
MPYKLIIKLNTGEILESADIAPNNPNHNYNHWKIFREIIRTGHSMKKRIKEVVEYNCKRS